MTRASRACQRESMGYFAPPGDAQKAGGYECHLLQRGVSPTVSTNARFQPREVAQELFMATLTDTPRKTKGSAFLIEESTPQDIFTPEDLSEEHLAVGHMVDEFWANEVEPNLPAIREKTPGLSLTVMRKSVELGLPALSFPGEYCAIPITLSSLIFTAE